MYKLSKEHMSQLEEIIRLGAVELKFLKSIRDFKNLYNHKLPFLIPKLTGRIKRETEVPLTLQIEPTNYCILKCLCCARRGMKRRFGYMGMKLFEKIIDNAADIRIKRVYLYLHGEPFLHPYIIDMISYIKRKGLCITLSTNGMLLTKIKSEAILQTGVNSSDYIRFSILGFSKNSHELIMKGVSHYQVINNLHNFLRLRKRLKVNGPITEAIFHIMPENESEIEHFVEYWRKVVDNVQPVRPISQQFNNHGNKNCYLHLRNTTCNYIWERMTIYWNGDVTTCMADIDGNHVFADLNEKSIQEIWKNSKLQSIKRKHISKKFQEIDLCATCDW